MKETEELTPVLSSITQEIPPAVDWKGTGLVRLAHQRETERDIIMIANPSMEDASGGLMCRFAGEASIWNPEDGTITEAEARNPGEEISVSVPANSARFAVFER